MPNELNSSGSILFGFISLIPLFFLVESLDSNRQALKWGGIWGIGFTLVQYFWLSRFGEFSLWTLSGVALVYLGYGSLFFGFLKWGFSYKGTLQPILLALIVTSFDYLRSIGYLAFPWNLIAHPFSRNLYLIQSADIGGTFLLVFLVSYTQAYFFNLTSRFTRFWEWKSHGIFLLLLWILNLGYGIHVLHGTDREQNHRTEMDLIFVQQNQDSWSLTDREQGIIDLQTITLEAKTNEPVVVSGQSFVERPFAPDLVLWSETSLTFLPQSLLSASHRFPQSFPFLEFLNRLDAPLLTGAPVNVDPINPHQGLMNGAVVFTQKLSNSHKSEPSGDAELNEMNWEIGFSYGKHRLIPFAEHVPTGNIPFISRFLEEQIGISGSGWQIGSSLVPFELLVNQKRLLIGIPICFEDSFFQHTRAMVLAGSNLFINITNNSWSGTYTAHGQHTAASIFRSIETRRPLIRSTNSGLTSIIDNHGRIVWALPEFLSLGVGVRVSLDIPESSISFYTFWGDWFAFLCLVLLSLIFLSDRWDYIKKTPRYVGVFRFNRFL